MTPGVSSPSHLQDCRTYVLQATNNWRWEGLGQCQEPCRPSCCCERPGSSFSSLEPGITAGLKLAIVLLNFRAICLVISNCTSVCSHAGTSEPTCGVGDGMQMAV